MDQGFLDLLALHAELVGRIDKDDAVIYYDTREHQYAEQCGHGYLDAHHQQHKDGTDRRERDAEHDQNRVCGGFELDRHDHKYQVQGNDDSHLDRFEFFLHHLIGHTGDKIHTLAQIHRIQLGLHFLHDGILVFFRHDDIDGRAETPVRTGDHLGTLHHTHLRHLGQRNALSHRVDEGHGLHIFDGGVVALRVFYLDIVGLTVDRHFSGIAALHIGIDHLGYLDRCEAFGLRHFRIHIH